MANALLELPAIARAGAGVELLELRPGPLELRRRARVVDLLDVDRVVDERQRPVGLDLEEPRAGGELEDLVPARCTRVDPALSVATSGA